MDISLTLRSWQPDDLDSLVEQANNPKIAQFLTDAFPHPYTREAGQAFIERVGKKDPTEVFAIVVDGKAVGGIGIHPQGDLMRKNAELGYWLGESYWGRGIVSEAIRRIVPYAFQHFDIVRLYARPFPHNFGSIKALEKNSFVLEGRLTGVLYKNGVFLDELMYAVRRVQ